MRMGSRNVSNSGQKRKTVLRTIRLGADISERMEAKAKATGSSVNSLLSFLVTRYVEWDELAQRFGFMEVSKNFFRHAMYWFSMLRYANLIATLEIFLIKRLTLS